jgi:hypothetical protein
MLRLTVGTIALFCTAILAAEEKKEPPQFEILGSIQIQAQKAFWDNVASGAKKNNLDEFWGRANFGGQFKAADFTTMLNIRAFPEGWGYEPLTGLTVKDSTDTIKLGVSKTSIARFLIEQAWVKYACGTLLEFRIGRYFTTTSKTLQVGNFLDQNSGPGFQSKLAYHNAIDVTIATGPLSSNILLGAGDKSLNTGYLRIYESVSLLEKKLLFAAGFRVNVFDRIYNEDIALQPRFAILGEFEIIKSLKPYVEIGILDTARTKDDADFVVPMVFGTTIPAGKILNLLVAEIEVQPGRTAIDKNKKVQDVPVHWNLYIDKKFGTRTRLQAGLFSDGSGASAGDVRFGLRYTGSLK